MHVKCRYAEAGVSCLGLEKYPNYYIYLYIETPAGVLNRTRMPKDTEAISFSYLFHENVCVSPVK